LTATEHVHHKRALKYWNSEADEQLAFCRITAMGLVRVTSQPHTFDGKPLPPNEAWGNYLRWVALPHVRLSPEPDGVDRLISDWSRSNLVSQRGWTDVYLAAFAVIRGLRLVTFDRGFEKYPGVELLLLEV
jgi:toxin-antitoxin system PIN domain toxin